MSGISDVKFVVIVLGIVVLAWMYRRHFVKVKWLFGALEVTPPNSDQKPRDS